MQVSGDARDGAEPVWGGHLATHRILAELVEATLESLD